MEVMSRSPAAPDDTPPAHRASHPVHADYALGARARAALLLARVALGACLVLILWSIARLYLGSGVPDDPDESLVAHASLFGFALAAAGVVVLFLLLRRARTAPI